MIDMAELSALETLLMGYAAGSLSPAEALVVTAHMALKPQSRRKVSEYESIGAQMLENEAPAPVTADCLAKLMQKIDACNPCQDKPAEHIKSQDCLPIPDAVYNLICGNCAGKPDKWENISQGVDVMHLRLPCRFSRKKLRLMRLEPGRKTPLHSHTGRELTLVLCGSFSDGTVIYHKGDLSIVTDPAVSHEPVAGDNGCICMTLTEAPLQFQNPLTRFLNVFLRF